MDIFTSVNNVLMEKNIRVDKFYYLNESLEEIVINTKISLKLISLNPMLCLVLTYQWVRLSIKNR